MPIPHLPEVRLGSWEELEKAGGMSQRQDIIEILAERFKLTEAEIELRDPSEGKTFAHRVDSAIAQSRIVGWLEPVTNSGRGVWQLSSVYYEDMHPK
jgi:hypothetical protein